MAGVPLLVSPHSFGGDAPIGTVQAHNNFYLLTICKQAFALIQNFKMFQNQHIF